MKNILLTLAVSLSLSMQAAEFGDTFPLTNTRYPSTAAFGQVLRSDGRNTYLFWTTRYAVRMTMLDGTRRAGVPIAGTVHFAGFDAMWADTHFIVAATGVRQPAVLATQAFNRRGEALATPYTIAEAAEYPRLAWNGNTLLLLYQSERVVRAVALTRSGRPVDGSREVVATDVSGGADVVADGTGFAAITASATNSGYESRLTTFDAAGKIVATKVLPAGGSALASNGRELVAVSTGYNSGVQALIVRADGSTKTAAIHTWPFGADLQQPAVTWDGTAWTVAYAERKEAYGVVSFLLHVTRVDREGAVLSREVTQGFGTPSLLRTADGVRVTFMREPTTYPPLLAATLPLAEHEPEVITYTAVSQQLLATAASNEATLFLWEELGDDKRTLFAGLRSANGEWRERRLGEDFSVQHAAASDGGYVMLFYKVSVINSYAAMALDSKLRTVWTTPLDPRFMTAIASNGDDYALAGIIDGNLTAVRLSSSGVLGTPVVIAPLPQPDRAPFAPQLASDGNGYLATWLTPDCPFFSCDRPISLLGARLDSNLQRVDATDLHLNGNDQIFYRTRLAWDGSRYVAAWLHDTSLYTATVSPSGPARTAPVKVATVGNATLGPLAGLRDGAAIAWQPFGEQGNNDHVAFLSNGQLAGQTLIARTRNDYAPYLTRTPDGRALYATSRLETAAPHHAVTRVVSAVADPIPVDPSDAPALTASEEGGAILLHWTPPPQPVNGYRLEYRIGDGSWNELDRWFTADERSTAFRTSGTAEHAFRLRAWNDAGTSAYSNVATPHEPRKRRAVRMR